MTRAVRYLTDDLLREVYLAPAHQSVDLSSFLAEREAPWSESFASASEETSLAVEAGLVDVMRATDTLQPDEIHSGALPECRARTHLEALSDLWRNVGVLNPTLQMIAHVLGCSANDALEPLPLLDGAPCPHADPIERALANTLASHHGLAPPSDRDAWLARQPPLDGRALGALGHIQNGLGKTPAATARDDTITLFGVRDPREEAEFTAALAQRMLESGKVDSPDEIGVLMPEAAAYAAALGEAFDRLGLPLSGQAMEPARRDPVGELLLILLTIFEGPAPRTALTSLYSSTLMPWLRETGCRMARETIERGFSKCADTIDGAGRTILDALRPVTSPNELIARLFAIDEVLTGGPLGPRMGELRSQLGQEIDWSTLRRIAEPRPAEAAGHDRFVEGTSLFPENALPWRPVRQLIVLGLAGRQWPRMPASSPFFTEGEIALIRETTGLKLQGRRERLARGLELFRRQLCAATEGATLLIPARDLRGERQPPSTGLALITHLLGQDAPEKLLSDIRATPQGTWPVSGDVPPLPAGRGAPVLPDDGELGLGVDLLGLRERGGNGPVAQSPSRLETLLVSPLAWLLDELGAKDRTWAPETLDIMTLGSLMHHVLEVIFRENAPVPTREEIDERVLGALADAIRRHASWLDSPSWSTERASLLREAETISRAWGRFLHETGARIIHNETDLSGNWQNLFIHGRADSLLGLPDGRILVVDHKRAGSGGRRERMVKGWDLQVALYRAMLEYPREETPLTRLVSEGSRPVTAYHTMLDGTILVDGDGVGIPGVEPAGNDISINALDYLTRAVAEVRAGTIRLNEAGDEKRLRRDCGITAYALMDNAFVAAFLTRGSEEVSGE